MEKQIQAALTVITSKNSSGSSKNSSVAVSEEGGDTDTDIERKLASALRNLGDSHFVTLYGSYNIWQEVR